jgi:uncharacterized protein YbbC (DUF1343 family)
VLDREAFEPVFAGIAMVKIAYDMYRDSFLWKKPPYEYVYDTNPFDVIAGTDKIRKAFEGGARLSEIERDWQSSLDEFRVIREHYLMY